MSRRETPAPESIGVKVYNVLSRIRAEATTACGELEMVKGNINELDLIAGGIETPAEWVESIHSVLEQYTGVLHLILETMETEES